MFIPKYRLRLTKKSFPNDDVACLGTQLISIIDFLKDFLPKHVWYGADIDAVGKVSIKVELKRSQLSLIGTDFSLVQYCSKIDQFIWGVFLCVNSTFLGKSFTGIEIETEDQSFRPIACDGIILEIRAFDTSYFEIYSADLGTIKKLKNRFNFCEFDSHDSE